MEASREPHRSSGVAVESRPFSQQLPQDFAAYLKRNNVDISSYDSPLEIPRCFAVLYPVPALTRTAVATVQEILRNGGGPAASLVKLLYSAAVASDRVVRGAVPCVVHESFVPAVRAKDCVFHSLDACRRSRIEAVTSREEPDFEASSIQRPETTQSRRQLPPFDRYISSLLSCIQTELNLPLPPSPVPWLLPNCLGRGDSLSFSGNAALLPSFPLIFALPPHASPRNCTPFRLGLIHPLDAASAAAAAALRPEPGDIVCDLCCAPGNKLLLLANAVAGLPAGRPIPSREARCYPQQLSCQPGVDAGGLGDSEQPTRLAQESQQQKCSEPNFFSARYGGMVVGVEGRRHRGDVCRRIVRRLGARNVLLVLQDGRCFTGGCTCSNNKTVECFGSSEALQKLMFGERGLDDATDNGDRRPLSGNASGRQSCGHNRPWGGGRLSRRKARRRDEAAEVPCIDLLAGLNNFIESDSDTVPASDGTRDALEKGTSRSAPPPSAANEAQNQPCAEASNRDCFEKFDKVLVDVECTHDGSLRHMQKFGRQWRWDDFRKKMQMTSSASAPKLAGSGVEPTRRAGVDYADSQEVAEEQSQDPCSTQLVANDNPVGPAKFPEESGIISAESVSASQRLPSASAHSTEYYVKLRQRQRQLLQRGFELLRPNGLLVYSTCSRCEDQNEQIVRDFLRCNDTAVLYPLPCRGLRNAVSEESPQVSEPRDVQPSQSSTTFWERCQLLMNEQVSGEWPAVPSSLFLDESLRRHPAAFSFDDVIGASRRNEGPFHSLGGAKKGSAVTKQEDCRNYRPCSCYFGPQQSGTSGLFLCCITKLSCPP
ncbi:NOL1/NOP2/sun family protein [Toxoplasma gondii GAB2-2007-GAL-DOM2]|uniref:NOL1/NOP2/sun family protein n=3 Tax=Toxoplasma gondii TaxID=5811 RepID=B9QF39_TOXGV|nr:NOL1/NOP2/sun family protein [Toxoplasma gondii VEG]KFG32102.1 NOL1/NOP2/sun family protein [Toxoplasma gondii GAB2-2007-GAL-DOM2]KFG33758.1 NOL1/NOP2/sun family protein [Toxoplasma gondii p89]CEL73632.1 TPA: putative nucleolar protein, Sun (Fmu) family protein or tRNA/rRNA cytosine-C5-methylase [Toxoplasma gondii VEG]